MASLSLCMIVRDAEASLGHALESARPFVDEMVVVDTGSRDGTPEVARSLGARVFHFPWCDDFSAARNHSLEQATGDWVFCLDADDVLPESSGRELRRLSAAHPQRDAAFLVTVEEEWTGRDGLKRLEGMAQCKLFPRHPDLRFCYRVHEQIVPAVQRLGLAIRPTAVTVRHAHRDRSAESEAQRTERNLRLAELDLAERPGDPFVLLNLGMTYRHRPGALPAAIDHLRRCLPGLAPASSTLLNAFLQLADAHAQAGDREAQLQVYLEALAQFPSDVSLLLRLGEACEQRADWRQAADAYQRALTTGQMHASVLHLHGGHAWAAVRLGRIYCRLGQTADAERLWLAFLERAPHEWRVRQALVELCVQTQRDGEAEQQLSRLPADNPDLEPLRLSLRGCIAVLREDWQKARADLLAAHRLGYRSAMHLHGLSVVLLVHEEFITAEAVLLELLRLAPNHPHAARNLKLARARAGRGMPPGEVRERAGR